MNVGGLDRRPRVLLAPATLAFGYRTRDTRTGTLGFVGGSDRLATAIIQRCRVNALLGVDTSPGG